jgi:hypothetical protein
MNTSTTACVSYAPVITAAVNGEKWTHANVILVRITPGIRICNTDLQTWATPHIETQPHKYLTGRINLRAFEWFCRHLLWYL